MAHAGREHEAKWEMSTCMKTKYNCFICSQCHPFSPVYMLAAVTLLFGVLASSAQTTNQFLYTGSETNITLNPGTYNITAYGAQGGSASGGAGGNGAEMEGQFSFATAVTLTLLVGGNGGSGSGGGGGGGSFVVNGSTALVIAGGGGGGGLNYSGVEGGVGLDLPQGGGGGGGGGLYGGGGGADYGTGGGGFLVGGEGNAFGTGGSSFLDGGTGGISYDGGYGGYGGGGGGAYGGGGGGGYCGGGGGNYGNFGGGGGSIIDSYAVAIITEANGVASPDDSPNGEIIITAVPGPLTYPPVLLITNVTAGMSVSNAAFTVMGITSDNVAMSDVLYSLNNGAWTSATTADNWTNWSAAVTLLPGTNTVAAYAVDTSGNMSATDSVTIVAFLPFSAAGDLFVPSYNGIYEFTPFGVQNAFISLSEPSFEVAFDHAGDLFVTEMEDPGDVIEFIPGAIERTVTVATGLSGPVGMAFDKAGDLFVSESFSGELIEITPSGTQKNFASGLNGPLALAFDRGGDLFVSSYQSVYEFTNNNGTLSSNLTIFASGYSFADGLSFDGAGDLFVADQGQNPGYGVIYEFTNNAGTLGTNSTIFASGLDQPWGLAFDSAGDLFEADQFSGNIYEFTPDGTQITFASGLDYPEGVSFAPAPELMAVATNRGFQLTVSMPSPYLSSIVQASTNLVNWCNIYTNTPPFTFTDSTSSAYPYRFYRALLGP
jgi:hypothetical protein